MSKDEKCPECGQLRPDAPVEVRWNNAIDWLLNSRHTADPDIQQPFWDHVDGKITLEELGET